MGQGLGKIFNSGNDYVFKTFYDAARVDGADAGKALLTSVLSIWQEYIPNLSVSIARTLTNYIGKKWRFSN